MYHTLTQVKQRPCTPCYTITPAHSHTNPYTNLPDPYITTTNLPNPHTGETTPPPTTTPRRYCRYLYLLYGWYKCCQYQHGRCRWYESREHVVVKSVPPAIHAAGEERGGRAIHLHTSIYTLTHHYNVLFALPLFCQRCWLDIDFGNFVTFLRLL